MQDEAPQDIDHGADGAERRHGQIEKSRVELFVEPAKQQRHGVPEQMPTATLDGFRIIGMHRPPAKADVAEIDGLLVPVQNGFSLFPIVTPSVSILVRSEYTRITIVKIAIA